MRYKLTIKAKDFLYVVEIDKDNVADAYVEGVVQGLKHGFTYDDIEEINLKIIEKEKQEDKCVNYEK